MGIVSDRVRKQVYKKCNGLCAYCGKPILFKAMQVDHIVPVYWSWSDEECAQNNVTRGSDHIENLLPSCKRCNKWKSSTSLEKFRAQVLDQHNKLMRDAPGYKMGIDFGFITHVPWDGKFYFEKMPGFCAGYKRITA